MQTRMPKAESMGNRARWAYAANLMLAIWLITSPVAFGYQRPELLWSDVASGALVLVFGLVAAARDPPWARWGICVVGIWLLVAPLVFWAPTSVAYANDTLSAALVIAFSILVPGMPGMHMLPGPEIPPGWSYNPSSWMQRGPIIALGLVGFFAARYLAGYQLGYIHVAWDPFFGRGTERVLTSEVSRAWPISDAGLGALTYLLEALSGFMGGVQRWRTMPWMVTMFGILVIPLGITSIVLVILQPVAVGSWCSLCLVAAVAMVIMIPLAVDEVFAMGQFLARSVREGQPFWHTFWMGGTVGGVTTHRQSQTHQSSAGGAFLREQVTAMVRGVSVPWTLALSAALGIWLMIAPDVFGTRGAAADSSHLAGALITTTAVIATAEVIRPARLVNVLLGLWVVAAPWLLAGAATGAQWNGVIVGLAVLLLSLPRGTIKEQFGTPT